MTLLEPLKLPLRLNRLDTLDPAALARWDAAVAAHPDATMFHLSAWPLAIRDTFGHHFWLLTAERGDQIVGLLPLILVRSALFGARLASNAFAVYGGPLTDDAEAATALDQEAVRLMAETGAKTLEYRNRAAQRPDWPAKRETYARFVMPIAPTLEANMKALPSKQRNMVRKGEKAGLCAIDQTEVDRAWRLYAESVRNLGTPAFPKRLFAALKRRYGDDCLIQTVERDGVAYAASLSLIFRDEIHIYYAGGSRAGRDHAANDFLFWSVLEAGRRRGLKRYDLGRSKAGTGAYDFKVKWGITPEPLHYEYQLAPGESLPDMNPNSPRYARFVAGWRRLPLWLANSAGPLLSRSLG